MGSGLKGSAGLERCAPTIIAAMKGGATLRDAAVQAEMSESTVKRWLNEGRREPNGPYGNFAFAIDFIREMRSMAGPSDEPVDDAEVQLHLSRAIRNGSVQAMKVWADAYGKRGKKGGEKPEPERSVIDELAKRRQASGS